MQGVNWLAKIPLPVVCLTVMETLMSACNSSGSSGRNRTNSIYPLIMQFSTDCQFAHAKAHRGLQRSKMTFQRNAALISPSLHLQPSSSGERVCDGVAGMACVTAYGWLWVIAPAGNRERAVRRWHRSMCNDREKIRIWSYWRLWRAVLLWKCSESWA